MFVYTVTFTGKWQERKEMTKVLASCQAMHIPVHLSGLFPLVISTYKLYTIE